MECPWDRRSRGCAGFSCAIIALCVRGDCREIGRGSYGPTSYKLSFSFLPISMGDCLHVLVDEKKAAWLHNETTTNKYQEENSMSNKNSKDPSSNTPTVAPIGKDDDIWNDDDDEYWQEMEVVKEGSK
ncbi:5849_t:CDS:2, partial [Acaulospora colombiana]